jgi:integrase
MTAAEKLKKVKLKNDDVAVFTPAEMTKILHAAPPHLVPILAIGAFSGIRMAELNRLDWSAVTLARCCADCPWHGKRKPYYRVLETPSYDPYHSTTWQENPPYSPRQGSEVRRNQRHRPRFPQQPLFSRSPNPAIAHHAH